MGRPKSVAPKKLSCAKDGMIPYRNQYTAGEIAFLMGVAHRTACKLIDDGLIVGFRLPSTTGCRPRERRVHHNALLAFVGRHPEYSYMIDKLSGVPTAEVPALITQPETEVLKCKKKPKAT